MIKIIYEDEQIIVVDKPAGMESQSSRGFEADVVSQLKNHLAAELSTKLSTKRTKVRGQACGKPGEDRGQTANRRGQSGGLAAEPYVGVIHRLDKPVSGIMVYAKTPKAAAALSQQVKSHGMEKIYRAVVCGQFVDNVGNYVDNLLKDVKTNCSSIAEPGNREGKRAELSYRVLGEARTDSGEILSLVEISLKTGRHHQIRVQFAGHGHPLWGDSRYNPEKTGFSLALCAVSLTFTHPATGQRMTFVRDAGDGAFAMFSCGPDKL